MIKTELGLGLAAIGRPEYLNIRNEADLNKTESFYHENAIKVMDYAYKQGIRHFDTAPSYGQGEAFLQEWFRQHPYKDLALSTKWGYTYVANWELGYKGPHEIKEHSVKKLIEQWSVSKHLLPALQVYQVHSATFESGILDNNEVLQKLFEIKKETGLKIGITTSGENQGDVLKYASQIRMNNKPLFESFQVTYNILEASTHELLKELMIAGRIVIIKEALANGRLFSNDKYKHYANLYSYLERLSKKYGVSADAIALRFIIDHLKPNIVLSGASSISQLSENMKSRQFNLEDQELISLSKYAVESNFYWNERSQMQWN